MGEIYTKSDEVHEFSIVLPMKLFNRIVAIVEKDEVINSIDEFIVESVKFYLMKKYPAVYSRWADQKFQEYMQKQTRGEPLRIDGKTIEKLEKRIGGKLNPDALMLLHMAKKKRR
jgi:hypothetical protein